MKKLLLFFCLFLMWSHIFAQNSSPFKNTYSSTPPIPRVSHASGDHQSKAPEHRSCFTVENQNRLNAKYELPSTSKFEKQLNNLKSIYIQKRAASRTGNNIITIPVIVHVIHNDNPKGFNANIADYQVYSQIDVLNEDFRKAAGTAGYNEHPDGADIEIEFAPAVMDEEGNLLEEVGIDRVYGGRPYWEYDAIQNSLKPNTIWDPTKYLNIWTVEFGGDMDGILGYAQFPVLSGLDGLPESALASTDGVVIGHQYFGREGNVSYPFNLGRTTTHEVGHWLGLRHIWGDGPEEDGCSYDDFCEDTPNAATANYGCKYIDSCPNDNAPDMIENYMDYTNDACMNIFTQDQKDRIMTVMNNSPRRRELLTSEVAEGPSFPIAKTTISTSILCPDESITLTDNSEGNPNSWAWIIYNSDNADIVGYYETQNIEHTFSTPGNYSLQLTVSNENGEDVLSYYNAFSVLSKVTEQGPYNNDFTDESNLADWSFYNPDAQLAWEQINIDTGNGINGCMYVNNYNNDAGRSDILFSPLINIENIANPYLVFDVAYARYNASYYDGLGVSIYSGCSTELNYIWAAEGGDLATTDDYTDAFVPSPDQWKTIYVPLENWKGINDLRIGFNNISGFGNNLFIDNVQIKDMDITESPSVQFRASKNITSTGESIKFSDESTSYPTTWAWEFEGGSPATSNQQHPFVSYNKSGVYKVTLSVTNEVGDNTLTKEEYITILEQPDITVTSSTGKFEICQKDTITLTASEIAYLRWYNEDQEILSESNSITVHPKETSIYYVAGANEYDGYDLDTVVVTVNPLPTIDLGKDQEITVNESITLAASENFDTYLWSDNSTENTLILSGNELGVGSFDISVTVKDANACSATDEVTITITDETTGINEALRNDIQVYPVPSSDHVTIELKNNTKSTQVDLYDMKGQLLQSKNTKSELVQMNISTLSNGIFFIKVSNENTSKTIKIIKE